MTHDVGQRLQLRRPIPFFPIPLGRVGRAPAEATLAPYAHTVYVSGTANGIRPGWYPSLGVGTLFFFNVLRLDVARGLRDGRWTFSFDAERALWGVL